MFDRAEAIKFAEMERRKAMASENMARIRQEVAQKVKVKVNSLFTVFNYALLDSLLT